MTQNKLYNILNIGRGGFIAELFGALQKCPIALRQHLKRCAQGGYIHSVNPFAFQTNKVQAIQRTPGALNQTIWDNIICDHCYRADNRTATYTDKLVNA